MSEVSSEAVEAAARAIVRRRGRSIREHRECGSDCVHVKDARAALIAALPYLVPEGTQPGCTGAPDCQAPAHVHGCYADTEGHCDDPHDHEDAAHQPARVAPLPVENYGEFAQGWNAALAWFAEHRGPRVVSTVEELDALPVGNVVMDAEGDMVRRFKTGWFALVSETKGDPWMSSALAPSDIPLPATVLFTPTTDE